MKQRLIFFLFFFPYGWTSGYLMTTRWELDLQCKKLLGEWTVRYSDDPRVPGKPASLAMISDTGMNRVRVQISPGGKLRIFHRYYYMKLLLLESLQLGRYQVEERNQQSLRLKIFFDQTQRRCLSFCGIGLEFQPQIETLHYEKPYEAEVDLRESEMFIIAKDDNEQSFYYHIVRSDALQEPQFQVPLSNLIFSQIISMLFTYCLHVFFHVSTIN